MSGIAAVTRVVLCEKSIRLHRLSGSSRMAHHHKEVWHIKNTEKIPGDGQLH